MCLSACDRLLIVRNRIALGFHFSRGRPDLSLRFLGFSLLPFGRRPFVQHFLDLSLERFQFALEFLVFFSGDIFPSWRFFLLALVLTPCGRGGSLFLLCWGQRANEIDYIPSLLFRKFTLERRHGRFTLGDLPEKFAVS